MPELRKSARLSGRKRKNEEVSEKEIKSKKVNFGSKIVPKKTTTNEKQSNLEIGDEIPDMILKNQDDEDVSLKDVARDNKIVVIFAYPKASTPGCTRQACGFRDNFKDLKQNAKVYGLSADNVSRQKTFQTKQNLPYDLLSDPQRELIGSLGCKKTPQSGIIRSHFIFYEGKLKFKRIKISPEVSISDAKKEVLELAKQLK